MLRDKLLFMLVIGTMSGFFACSSVNQSRAPAYDGWSVLAALPASNSETNRFGS